MTKKLKDLLSEVFEDVQKVDRHKVSEGVRNFGIVGKSLYNNSNIMEVANQLAEIAEQAHHHILGEQDDWFDKISVNRNMKSLKGGVVEFQKTAKEAHALNQRLTSLYEDIGHVLNRYYEIDEVMSEDKGDMDNDGKDEPDSEEYMDNKDAAIKKAMKNETKAAPGELDNNDDEKVKLSHGSQYDTVSEDQGDMDNDGKDEPDDEEYLDNKDDAIKKAMGETYQTIKNKPTKKLKDLGNVSSGIPSLGSLVSKFKR